MLNLPNKPLLFDTQDNTAQHFLEDTLALFSGRKTGHMNAHAFNEPNPAIQDDPVRGGEHWTRMIERAVHYYLVTKEAQTVQAFAEEIGAYLPAGLMSVDLGPGESEAVYGKTIPFNGGLRKPAGFVAADVNSLFASSASNTVEDATGIPSRSIIGNFLEEELNLAPDRQAVMSLFGGLLCNFCSDRTKTAGKHLQEAFDNLARNMKPGDYLVITQDTNQNKDQLLKAYSHPDMALYILSVLHKIRRDLPTKNFDPDSFEFVAKWNAEEHLLSLNARLKKDCAPQSFEIANVPFTVGHDRNISLVNSYKFPVGFFIEAAKRAGFISKKLLMREGNPIALHLFQYRPDHSFISEAGFRTKFSAIRNNHEVLQ